jgi:hypothetical protein
VYVLHHFWTYAWLTPAIQDMMAAALHPYKYALVSDPAGVRSLLTFLNDETIEASHKQDLFLYITCETLDENFWHALQPLIALDPATWAWIAVTDALGNNFTAVSPPILSSLIQSTGASLGRLLLQLGPENVEVLGVVAQHSFPCLAVLAFGILGDTLPDLSAAVPLCIPTVQAFTMSANVPASLGMAAFVATCRFRADCDVLFYCGTTEAELAPEVVKALDPLFEPHKDGTIRLNAGNGDIPPDSLLFAHVQAVQFFSGMPPLALMLQERLPKDIIVNPVAPEAQALLWEALTALLASGRTYETRIHVLNLAWTYNNPADAPAESDDPPSDAPADEETDLFGTKITDYGRKLHEIGIAVVDASRRDMTGRVADAVGCCPTIA